MVTTLWVLGAEDVEMAKIEECLGECPDGMVAYATNATPEEVVSNTLACPPRPTARVSAASANQARGVILPALEDDFPPVFDQVILVECDGEFLRGLGRKVMVVNHHRSGDPGFGRPPERFLEGSSVGQVWRMLRHAHTFAYDHAGKVWYVLQTSGLAFVVPYDIVLTAAADHCLEAAYRGRCPGVDPEELLEWRAATRAAFQQRPVEDVLADINAARARIRAAAVHRGDPGETPVLVADLSNQLHISELPEAACREGIAVIAMGQDGPRKGRHTYATPDPRKGVWEAGDKAWEYNLPGREKIVLLAAPAALVEAFLAGDIVPGLRDRYGDPARGFAGGYFSEI